VAQQSRHVKALVFNEFRWAQVFFTGLWMQSLQQVLTEQVGLHRFVQRPRCKNSWQSTCCKCAVQLRAPLIPKNRRYITNRVDVVKEWNQSDGVLYLDIDCMQIQCIRRCRF
jgi:hypothetical protein